MPSVTVVLIFEILPAFLEIFALLFSRRQKRFSQKDRKVLLEIAFASERIFEILALFVSQSRDREH
jgi:hypothetical protein